MTAQAPAKIQVETYAREVVAGIAPACRFVRLAAQRHLDDLETGSARGLQFDEDAAAFAIDFFSTLQHTKGEWAGTPLTLEPWQQFIVGNLFGWLRADGARRFRVAYIEVPRKNGKSTLVAGFGLLLAFFDDEPGAEVYAAATKRDQAKIVWGEARAMVLKATHLKKRISVLVGNLHQEASRSKFMPLGADVDGMDGLNISGAIVDELHAHKSRGMWDVIETATGSRRQPLTVAITTAGFDRQSVCYEQHDYGAKILEGILEDDSFFAYIAGIDDGDDWRDPDVWAKANPNLGVSVKLDDLERKCAKAKSVPGEQNAFLRLHLDVWTQQDTRWLDIDVWNEGGAEIDEETLKGRECFGGLDLSTTTDITAFELYFPNEDGPGGQVLSFFWVPEENIHERSVRDRVPYELWAEQGLIFPTEGSVIDYEAIRMFIRDELGALYNIREIGADPWNAAQIVKQLEGDGFTIEKVGQGFASMTSPTKELGKLVAQAALIHGNNPVLRWMASNVAVEQDAAGNLKPSKAKSRERIDGIVALIMAVDRATRQEDGEVGGFWARDA